MRLSGLGRGLWGAAPLPPQVVQVLLAWGRAGAGAAADLAALDGEGHTALDLALSFKHAQVRAGLHAPHAHARAS